MSEYANLCCFTVHDWINLGLAAALFCVLTWLSFFDEGE